MEYGVRTYITSLEDDRRRLAKLRRENRLAWVALAVGVALVLAGWVVGSTGQEWGGLVSMPGGALIGTAGLVWGMNRKETVEMMERVAVRER